jgi:hypothetical protein
LLKKYGGQDIGIDGPFLRQFAGQEIGEIVVNFGDRGIDERDFQIAPRRTRVENA